MMINNRYSKKKNLGAAMSEYIPILLAITFAGVVSFEWFGGTAQDQGSNIAVELAGHEAQNFNFPQAGPIVTPGGIGSRPQLPSSGSGSGDGGGSGGGTPGGGGGPGGIPGGGGSGGGNTGGGGNSGGGNTGGGGSSGGGGGTPGGGGGNPGDPGDPGDTEPPPLLSVDGLVEFGGGVWDGVVAQGEGILQMVLNPVETVENFYILGRALIVDPAGTIAAIGEEIQGDIEAVLSGNPRELGRVIGENVSPAALARLASRLTRVASRLDDDGRTNVRGCSRRSSFTGDTLVWTDTGLKAIRDIEVGDYVLSRHERTFEDSYQKVVKLLGREVSHYYEVEFYDSVINVTEEHPFWQQGAGWVEAQNLYRGEIAAAAAGDLTIRNVKRVDERVRVYNFEVANNHTYFVGEYGLWVHNQDDEVCDLRNDVENHPVTPDFNDLSRQTLGRGPSSSVLGGNLEAVGVTRPANTAAHHIVAGSDRRAADVRRILDREGIDINEASNGVFLPCNSSVACPPATTHSRVHTDVYYAEVTRRLEQAAPGDVRNVLRQIADELSQGTFPY